MFGGRTRAAPRNAALARCTDFGIVKLENIGDTSGTVTIVMVIQPYVYNSSGPVAYHWSSSEGDDSGSFTDNQYLLTVTGSSEHKDIKVSLTVTDDNGTATITDVLFPLEFV